MKLKKRKRILPIYQVLTYQAPTYQVLTYQVLTYQVLTYQAPRMPTYQERIT